ncbi:MAG: carbohydrate ABC transporter permease, partial [Candidatus Gallimonas sp.]
MNKRIEKKRIVERTSFAFQIGIFVVLSLVALCQIFPFWLQIVSALQPLDHVPEDGKIYLLPVSWNFQNFYEALVRVELLQGIQNSLFVAIGYLLLSTVFILLMGYTLGKKQFRGKTVVKIGMLMTMAIPGELLMVSNYLLVSQLGWLNRYSGLILPGLVNVTGIFLLMSFMNTIPEAMLESAELDGAGELRKIVQIIVPLCLPVLATYWILTFVSQWNDYLWPMIVTNRRDMFTIQLKLKEFNPYYFGFADETLKSAAHILTLVPVI